jgi:hypothetical protein
MTQLKDVIHFYLGCRVVHPALKNNRVLTAVWMQSLLDKGIDVKLILRRLSDMTEEECEEYGMMYEQGKYDSQSLEFDCKIGLSAYYIGTKNAAERIRALLKAGFDLFGLIESGQAIDAKTLQQ